MKKLFYFSDPSLWTCHKINKMNYIKNCKESVNYMGYNGQIVLIKLF